MHDSERAFARALPEPEIRVKLDLLGVVVEGSTPEALGAVLKSEVETWRPIIRAAGIGPGN